MNKIIICTYDENLLPEKKTPGSVCRDLKIANDLQSPSQTVTKAGSGIKTYMPIGRQCKIYARSGLNKYGLMLANNVGIIDADYRGEYIFALLNFSKDAVNLEKYTRTCQIEFAPYYIGSQQFGSLQIPEFEVIVDKNTYDNFAELYPSERGEGRFGSTGK